MDAPALQNITGTAADQSPERSPAAWLLAWADRHRHWLFAAILLVYLAGFTGRWQVAPDNALYMSLGRSLAEGQGFVYHGEKHNWFEPGLPLVIAASFRLFGHENYLPIVAFMLLCSLTGLFLTYRLILRHAGRPTAVTVICLLAICETSLRYGFQVVTDTPFLVALLIYLLGYERLLQHHSRRAWVGWPMLAVGMFLMVTFRPTAITFVGAVGLTTAWHLLRGPNRLRHVLIGLLTLACFLSFRLIDPRRSDPNAPVAREARLKALLTTHRDFALRRIFTVTVPDFFEEILPEAILGAELAPGLDTVASVAIVASGVMLVQRRVLWGVWCGATFFQCMTWLPRGRYLLPILPLLIYGMWRGLVWLTSRPRSSRDQARVIFVVLMLIYVGHNCVYVAKLLYEQRLIGINREGQGDPAFTPFLEMAREIRERVPEDALVFASDHRELTYFSRRKVEGSPWSYRWPRTPEEEQQFYEHIAPVNELYAVLPDTTSEPHVAELLGRLEMRASEEVAVVERPPDRRGRELPPLTLYRLEPAAGAAATAPAEPPR